MNWTNQVANVILKLRLILSLSISGIVKTGRNTFYKFEYKHKICLPYIIQTGLCKKVRKILLETSKATCEEVHV